MLNWQRQVLSFVLLFLCCFYCYLLQFQLFGRKLFVLCHSVINCAVPLSSTFSVTVEEFWFCLWVRPVSDSCNYSNFLLVPMSSYCFVISLIALQNIL